MNSISFLDAVLTRSLSSSRSGSGTNTPARHHDAHTASEGNASQQHQHQHQHQHQQHASLNRRASDYSLTREREREKRRVAASLGLTSLDDERHQRRPSKRSSRKSSRSSSARQSETEFDATTSSNRRSSNEHVDAATLSSTDRSNDGSKQGASSHRHPKSYSEGYDEADEVRRMRMRRAGSTPAPVRIATSRGWGNLWGFGDFLEESSGLGSSSSSNSNLSHMNYGTFLRRSSTNFGTGRLQPSGMVQGVDAGGNGASASLLHGRRASTGDADAVMMGYAPDAHLSEREREDVVDLEGYDPDDDISALPSAPPSTPFPSGLVSQRNDGKLIDSPTGSPTTPDKMPQHVGQPSATSRLSSLLFGALNPLTDDYFGPQPPTSSRPGAGRRRVSETSERKRRADRSRKGSQASKDSHSESSITGHAREESEKSLVEKLEDTAAADTATGVSSDPPPPYSNVATGSSAPSSSVSTPSVLLPSPTLLDGSRSDAASMHSSPKRTIRIANGISRSARNTFDFLRRLLLAILLTPYRLYQYSRRAGKLRAVEAQAVRHEGEQEPLLGRHGKSTANGDGKMFQTASQAERPSAARHLAQRRKDQADHEKRSGPMGGVKSSDSDSQEDEDDEEVVTEDQAEARAIRKAQKAAQAAFAADAQARVEAQTSTFDQRVRASSRLLPNPNPVDPLLAHDRNAKLLGEKTLENAAAQQSRQAQHRSGAAAASAVVNRGPLSSLIHHSPKVLVLDLDETLIHSTSRSPTWSALADKSKSRMAVTTGGSLLGLEGLGGVLGLRGQVGVRPHQVEVVLDGRSIIYHVYKRPHVDTFLRKVASWYHVVVFTASVQEYADPVIDWLDQGRGLISARLFRESCTYRNGSYYKNLSMIDNDLSRICLVDNSPASYMINQANGIPIEGWTHDPNDEALLDLLPVLDSLRFASDVRHILGIRGFSDPACKQLPAPP